MEEGNVETWSVVIGLLLLRKLYALYSANDILIGVIEKDNISKQHSVKVNVAFFSLTWLPY